MNVHIELGLLKKKLEFKEQTIKDIAELISKLKDIEKIMPVNIDWANNRVKEIIKTYENKENDFIKKIKEIK